MSWLLLLVLLLRLPICVNSTINNNTAQSQALQSLVSLIESIWNLSQVIQDPPICCRPTHGLHTDYPNHIAELSAALGPVPKHVPDSVPEEPGGCEVASQYCENPPKAGFTELLTHMQTFADDHRAVHRQCRPLCNTCWGCWSATG